MTTGDNWWRTSKFTTRSSRYGFAACGITATLWNLFLWIAYKQSNWEICWFNNWWYVICANQRVLFTHSYCYTCLHLFSAYEHFLCCIPDDDAEKALVKSEARRGGALAGQSHKTSHCSTF
jgi:hypothetical protein